VPRKKLRTRIETHATSPFNFPRKTYGTFSTRRHRSCKTVTTASFVFTETSFATPLQKKKEIANLRRINIPILIHLPSRKRSNHPRIARNQAKNTKRISQHKTNSHPSSVIGAACFALRFCKSIYSDNEKIRQSLNADIKTVFVLEFSGR
jgi:hypothetical protein